MGRLSERHSMKAQLHVHIAGHREQLAPGMVCARNLIYISEHV
jgi:hypothetical protein